MKVLFIGGTGVISSACSPLAVDRGIELFILNRGQTDRPIPKELIKYWETFANPKQFGKS
jgi:hypothetical protein